MANAFASMGGAVISTGDERQPGMTGAAGGRGATYQSATIWDGCAAWSAATKTAGEGYHG